MDCNINEKEEEEVEREENKKLTWLPNVFRVLRGFTPDVSQTIQSTSSEIERFVTVAFL